MRKLVLILIIFSVMITGIYANGTYEYILTSNELGVASFELFGSKTCTEHFLDEIWDRINFLITTPDYEGLPEDQARFNAFLDLLSEPHFRYYCAHYEKNLELKSYSLKLYTSSLRFCNDISTADNVYKVQNLLKFPHHFHDIIDWDSYIESATEQLRNVKTITLHRVDSNWISIYVSENSYTD